MADKLQVAIVGTGFGKSVHIPAFQHSNYFTVGAIWGHDRAKAEAVARDHHIPIATDQLAQILELPQIQVVSITTPPFLHYEQAKAVLLAGKHIFLEKPVTLKVQEAEELAEIAHARNLIIGVDFEFRAVPQWRYFRDLLTEDKVGRLRLVTLQWLVSGRANPDRLWNWYSQKSLGGGALGALASHSFDYVRWLFGEVRRISAQLSTGIKFRPDHRGIAQPVDSDDSCSLMLELTDGTPVHMVISTVAYHGTGHWLTAYGDQGTLTIGSSNLKDYIHGFQVWYGSNTDAELTLLPTPATYDLPLVFPDGRIAPVCSIVNRLGASIRESQPMIPAIAEGIASQRLIDLAHQSHHSQTCLDVQ
jgi:predicted dehydrogenase